MGITVSQLLVEVSAVTKPAEDSLHNLDTGMESNKSHWSGLVGGILDFGKAAAGTVIGAGVALVGFLTDAVKNAGDLQNVETQTNAVIKSTGDVSGVTAASIDKLAESLSTTTTFSRDTVQAAENMLLTFTKIGKDVMPQATQTVLDMSQALGQDTKSSAIQLGKALDDPIKGITALSRVGVTFDQDQKNLIKTYVAHGETAKAQAIILKELQKEFGGSATAAGTTLGGSIAILHNKWDELTATVGEKVIPIISSLVSTFAPIIEQFASKLPAAASIAVGFFNEHIEPAIKALMPTVEGLAHFLANDLVPALMRGAPVAEALGKVLLAAGMVVLNDFLPPIKQLAPLFLGLIIPAFASLKSGLSGLDLSTHSAAFSTFKDIVGGLSEIFSALVGIITDDVLPEARHLGDFFAENLLPMLTSIGRALASTLGPALHEIGGLFSALGPLVHAVFDLFNKLLPVIIPVAALFAGTFALGLAVVVGLVHGLIGALTGIVDALTGVVKFISGALDFIVGLFTLNGDKVKKGLGEMASGVLGIFKGLFEAVIKGIVGFVSGFLGFIDHLTGGALSRFGDMVGGIVSGIASLPGKLGQLVGGILGFFGNLWDQLVKGAEDFISTFIQKMLDGVTGAVQSFGSALHKLVSTAVHNIPVVGGLIPNFALGGTAPGGTTLVGEQGPELVNLPSGSDISPAGKTEAALASSGGGGGRGGPVTLIIEMNGRALVKQLLPEMVGQIRLKTGVKI